MPIRRMALAGMVAAFGAAGWYMVERGPQAVAHVEAQAKKPVSSETVKAIIGQKGLSVAEQEALMGRMQRQFPKTAQAIRGWTPVSAEKLVALHDAYQGLSASERQAIASEVGAWQQQVWRKYPSVRKAWTGEETPPRVAENLFELAAADRAQLDTSVATLWERIAAQNPEWAKTVDAIMSAK